MNETTEIRYQANGNYVTESFSGTNTAAAIAAIKARYGGNVQINSMTIRPPQPPPQSGNSNPNNR